MGGATYDDECGDLYGEVRHECHTPQNEIEETYFGEDESVLGAYVSLIEGLEEGSRNGVDSLWVNSI